MGDAGHGLEVRRAARRISELLLAPGFEPETGSTVLLLNSLITAFHSRRRIYLNAFQRAAEILDHFGHRLHRLRFDVHSLNPQAIIPEPQAQDVVVTLASSLRTEPVLVSLLHADQVGLYRFVLTAQSAEEARRKLQGVLPVHIPSRMPEEREEEAAARAVLPLGSLFELRAFLYLEAVVEALHDAMEKGGLGGPREGARPPGEPDPALMATLQEVRGAAARVPGIMRALVEQYRDRVDALGEAETAELLALLVEAVELPSACYVIGYGRNNPVGGMFAHRLANLGIDTAMTPSRLERPSRPGDRLVALTGSGHTYEVLQRMSGARRAGLRTAALTAVAPSSVTRWADVTLLVPASIEPRVADAFAARQVHPSSPPRPTASTFSINTLLTLEAVVAVLMRRLGRTETSLRHTDAWQGFDAEARESAAEASREVGR